MSFAGGLLFSSVVVSLCSVFFHFSPLPAGLLQWAMAVLLFRQVPWMVRIQSLILTVVGCLALYEAQAGGTQLLSALYKNQAMIAMLAAVGFLRLVPFPDTLRILPMGRRALWQTLFGVHWLGSFTNISAMVLFGDRIGGDSSKLLSP